MILTIPMRLPSASNLREHHMVRHRRVKAQREVVRIFIGGKAPPALPVVVTLTRVAPQPFDDDNIRGAFKAMRDEIAAWFGVADNHPGIRWEYAQRRGAPKAYAVEVRVEARP